MQIFDVPHQGKTRKIYSLEETYGGEIQFLGTNCADLIYSSYGDGTWRLDL